MTSLRRCAIAISWLLALSPRPVLADEPTAEELPLGQRKFRLLGAGDGLRNLVIASIAQDASGLLWLGTEDGVYRFDGDRFTRFQDEAHVIGVGPDGNACIGYRTGLKCWDGAGFSRARTRGMPEIPVRTMASFGGKLWVGSDAGLYVGDGIGAFAPAPGWSSTTPVVALWSDRAGLVAGDGETIRLGAGDGVWHAVDAELDAQRIDGVLRDREGALWIRTPRRMWLLPRGATRGIDISGGLPTRFDLIGATSGMALDQRGNVLVGTDMGVAYRAGDHWHLIDRSVGMPAASTRSVFVDREGTLWIGAAGLFQMLGRGLVEHYDAASGLPGDLVWTFQRDAAGTLWLGTNRCLLRAVDRRWQCLPGTEGRAVRSIAFPPQGGMFIGGAPSELIYIDATGRVTAVVNDEWPAETSILSLGMGPGSDLWIATKAGLYRLPGAQPGPIEHVAIPGVRPDRRFANVIGVGDQVWTATDEGLLVLDRGAWHRFDTTAGFPSTVMRRVMARADGRLCVTYNAAIGLTCFRYSNGRVSDLESIGPAQGLTAGMVYFLGEDRQRRLWIGTGDGIDVLTQHGIDHFDENSGLAGNDSSSTAFLLDRDGSLWLGATGGATHFLAQGYKGPPAAPRTAFLGGRLGDQPVLDARPALETSHDRNALTVDFAASSLLDTRRVEYSVRLSPTETEWSVTHQRQIRYPALPPGSYRVDVRSRIGAGDWGPATELPFVVLPAWWQTWWFLVGIALLIGAAIKWRQRFVLVRRTEQLHARADASFRAVVDLMPDLISVYRDRRLIYLNVANRRFLGADGPGDRWTQLELIDRIHPNDRSRVAELFRRLGELGAGDTSAVTELQLRGADGSWRICELSAIQVDIGGALTVVASGRDVTERKRMHAKLLVSDRMASLGTLAAGIAHEINNPLAYVAGNLEAMAESLTFAKRAERAADCDELSAVVADARDGAERVRKIVQGLRSFSRSEQREQRVPLALADVLESAIRLTGNELRHRAQLVRELHPVPRVIADDGRLTQVFINLLVNAAHAIPEGHSDNNRIIVRTCTDAAGRAVAEVEDTGKGMPPEVAARVFDPFFTTKDVGVGTGLGLSICHGIISGLGGQIAIDSTPGRGTIVRVLLPPHAGEPAPAPAPHPAVEPPRPEPAERRQRVMLVDDEPQVAQTMERLLRRDYDVTLAGCGRDAIELISGGARFDAIVSDVMMPNMTGIELIEELQRIAPDQAQRLIFLSGGAFTAQTRERLDQLGAPQLEKPITARELRACVKRIATDQQAA